MLITSLLLVSDNYVVIVREMSSLKIYNRQHNLSMNNKQIKSDDVIVSIMADLQQRQDQESELMIKAMIEMVSIMVYSCKSLKTAEQIKQILFN